MAPGYWLRQFREGRGGGLKHPPCFPGRPEGDPGPIHRSSEPLGRLECIGMGPGYLLRKFREGRGWGIETPILFSRATPDLIRGRPGIHPPILSTIEAAQTCRDGSRIWAAPIPGKQGVGISRPTPPLIPAPCARLHTPLTRPAGGGAVARRPAVARGGGGASSGRVTRPAAKERARRPGRCLTACSDGGRR